MRACVSCGSESIPEDAESWRTMCKVCYAKSKNPESPNAKYDKKVFSTPKNTGVPSDMLKCNAMNAATQVVQVMGTVYGKEAFTALTPIEVLVSAYRRVLEELNS